MVFMLFHTPCMPSDCGGFVACTNPCFCLFRVEVCPAQGPALCGDDLGWESKSWQKTPGWPSRHTCHLNLRCAPSCCWMMLMTPMTRCSHSGICSKRWRVSNTQRNVCVRTHTPTLNDNYDTWISCRVSPTETSTEIREESAHMWCKPGCVITVTHHMFI